MGIESTLEQHLLKERRGIVAAGQAAAPAAAAGSADNAQVWELAARVQRLTEQGEGVRSEIRGVVELVSSKFEQVKNGYATI